MGCLYMLTFPNGKSYIGITSASFERRLAQHRYCARARSKSSPLYDAMRKYGEPSAKTLVIANDRQYLYDLEQRAIEAYSCRVPAGYNLTDGGPGAVGAKRTEQQRQAASKRLKGVPNGSTWLRGRKRPPEDRAKISAGLLGHSVSEETRRKIGATKLGNKYCAGRVMPVEHKEKIAAAQRGVPRPYARRPMSEAIRQKISATKRTRPPLICPHCQLANNNPGLMARFHFGNCKQKVSWP